MKAFIKYLSCINYIIKYKITSLSLHDDLVDKNPKAIISVCSSSNDYELQGFEWVTVLFYRFCNISLK